MGKIDMKYNRACEICGKSFKATRSWGKFCSPECRLIKNRKNLANFRSIKAENDQILRSKGVKKKKKSASEMLEEAQKMAREEGLTYGFWVGKYSCPRWNKEEKRMEF